MDIWAVSTRFAGLKLCFKGEEVFLVQGDIVLVDYENKRVTFSRPDGQGGFEPMEIRSSNWRNFPEVSIARLFKSSKKLQEQAEGIGREIVAHLSGGRPVSKVDHPSQSVLLFVG